MNTTQKEIVEECKNCDNCNDLYEHMQYCRKGKDNPRKMINSLYMEEEI